MRRNSLLSAFNTIGRAAKQQLTPSSKKDGSKHSRRRRDSNSSYSDISSSEESDSYSDESDISSESNLSVSRRSKGRSRYHNDRGHSRRNYESRRGHRRHHRRSRNRHSSHHDDAGQMLDLLTRLLPFYGTGDYNSDALVIDTIHRLPSHALEMTDHNGTTLLLLVCQYAAYDLFPTLLSKGCDVNASNNAGATPLHFACFTDTYSAESAKALIRAGAIAEVVEHEWGCTPLHWAAFAGDAELCKVLCIAGASPTTKDKGGNDPISYSMQSGNAECSSILESFRTDKGGNEGNLRWDRMIDGRTGASFYHNKETGESLWGDTYRESILPREDDLDSKSIVERSPDKEERQVDENPISETTLAETTGIDEVKSSPTADDDAVSRNADPTAEILIDDDSKSTTTTPNVKHSTPDRRSSYQSSLNDIVEVESLVSNDDEAAINSEVDVENKSLNEGNLDSGSLHSWDKEDAERRDSRIEKKFESANQDSVHEQSGVGDAVEKEEVKEELDPLNEKTNRSFEERMSLLHEKMEHQLLGKLQHLEEKISHAQQQKNEASAEETMKLKEELSESTTTVMQLKTEIASKDLEMIKLRQQIIHVETLLEESLVKPEISDAHVGDGELNPDDPTICGDEILAEKAAVEQELSNAKMQTEQTAKLLENAEYQLKETMQRLQAAEQQVKEEKASCDSMMALLEEKGKDDERVDKALLDKLAAEKERSEASLTKLREETVREQEVARNEIALIQSEKNALEDELAAEKTRICSLEDHLTSAIASQCSSLMELKVQHDKELNELKSELTRIHSEEVQALHGRLKEEQLSRMELEIASNGAVDAMERAVEKQIAAETKLKEMEDMINETENLKTANDKLHTSLQAETEKRKVLHNQIEDMKGRIRVYVRVRPLSNTETKAGYVNVLTKEDDRTVVMAADPATSAEIKDWEFDKIFNGSSGDGNTQEAIFKDTSLLITSAIDGFNVCIFAYGQTGSGKTYTMFGGEEENKGLAPRVAFELFSKLQEKENSHAFEVSISMLELYTDKLNDLLVSKEEGVPDMKIRLAEHTSSGLVEVEGAKVKHVENAERLLETLNQGAKSRASSSTKMNADSSRSHMIATIVLSLTNKRTGKIIRGKLTLVDLAGSERVGKSGAAGQQLKEAQSINKSLSSLGDVIGALTSGSRQHVPYRNHPLTMLMSDSIGGNAKTLMFVCCSPADYNRKESTNSLDFAKRCRNVTNQVVSSKSHGNQIRALRSELNKIKDKKQVNPKPRSTGMRRPMKSHL